MAREIEEKPGDSDQSLPDQSLRKTIRSISRRKERLGISATETPKHGLHPRGGILMMPWGAGG